MPLIKCVKVLKLLLGGGKFWCEIFLQYGMVLWNIESAGWYMCDALLSTGLHVCMYALCLCLEFQSFYLPCKTIDFIKIISFMI